MDRTLVLTDITSGQVQWNATLSSAPLCLDVTPDGAYIGMGMLDGTVHFYSVRTGKFVMAFQAHESKVFHQSHPFYLYTRCFFTNYYFLSIYVSIYLDSLATAFQH
jgi:hypothetical protein